MAEPVRLITHRVRTTLFSIVGLASTILVGCAAVPLTSIAAVEAVAAILAVSTVAVVAESGHAHRPPVVGDVVENLFDKGRYGVYVYGAMSPEEARQAVRVEAGRKCVQSGRVPEVISSEGREDTGFTLPVKLGTFNHTLSFRCAEAGQDALEEEYHLIAAGQRRWQPLDGAGQMRPSDVTGPPATRTVPVASSEQRSSEGCVAWDDPDYARFMQQFGNASVMSGCK